MEEYLLQHNVTIDTFWMLVALWVAGLALLILLWWRTIQIYKWEKKEGYHHVAIIYVGMGCLTWFEVPLLAMGAWHFINMVTTLLWGFNLY